MDSQTKADLILTEILKIRQFQKAWIEETVDTLRNIKFLKTHQECVSPSKSGELAKNEIKAMLRELKSNCDMAVKCFVNNTHLGHNEKENQVFDSKVSSAFELSLNISQLSQSKSFKLERWLFLGKRLGRLLNSFSIIVSKAYNNGKALSLAKTLCELMYKYEEHLDQYYPDQVKKYNIAPTIDHFYKYVIKALVKMCKFEKCQNVQNKSPQLKISNQRPQSSPKSFLLAPELELARERIRAIKDEKQHTKQQTLDKSIRCVSKDNLLNKSNNNIWNKSKNTKRREYPEFQLDRAMFEAYSQHALSMAARVTSEVVGELNKKV
ncbi:unnamed protein product [Bursaphelenchus okinawaensis]|uniref:Uncharacterized protein n=1 Tax=Bursaphelenchus okinawaensis TaxID=465554 RepID=A0A811JU05_9BILA|nr:unnamed protein product [Bursaphelenchus okinawaensis]CAG9082999.1 unnamed protein product [Bursaphelenchus okinawaensis]